MDTELTAKDYKMLTTMLDDLIDVVGENENHVLAPLMDFIGDLIETYEDKHVIKICDKESNSSADLLSQETDDPEYAGAATPKPHRPETVGRPATLPRLKLTDLLSQEDDDSAFGEIDTGPAVGNEV